MKHKNTMYLILLTIFILSLPICAYADNSVIISKDDFSTDTEFQNAIDNAFENYENFTIVLDDDTISPVLSMSASPLSADAVLYNVKNVQNKSNSFGKDYLNVSGDPGITIGLSHAKTKSYALQFGATFGCDKSFIANATWGSSKGSTLTYSGTWKVPSKSNGKQVKRGYLHMRPEYKVKSYTVYHKNDGTNKWIKDGSSTTKKAYGVNIRKTFTYK